VASAARRAARSRSSVLRAAVRWQVIGSKQRSVQSLNIAPGARAAHNAPSWQALRIARGSTAKRVQSRAASLRRRGDINAHRLARKTTRGASNAAAAGTRYRTRAASRSTDIERVRYPFRGGDAIVWLRFLSCRWRQNAQTDGAHQLLARRAAWRRAALSAAARIAARALRP